uniref:Ig-like domain-containing protein n=1 Tax=Felis catus TaxID=9685 RepID=A0ABI7ZI53_FELCA
MGSLPDTHQEGCGALVGPKEISGFEGDTVSLQCTYREELRKHKKYWCKESGFIISRCSSTVYAGDDGQERTEGRVSLQDNPQELTLKVTLRKLTLQDAGKYFCGVSKLGRDESFLVSLLVFPGNKCLSFPGWGMGAMEGKRDRWAADRCWTRFSITKGWSARITSSGRGAGWGGGGEGGSQGLGEVTPGWREPQRLFHKVTSRRSVKLCARCLSFLPRCGREIAMAGGGGRGERPTE